VRGKGKHPVGETGNDECTVKKGLRDSKGLVGKIQSVSPVAQQTRGPTSERREVVKRDVAPKKEGNTQDDPE